MKYIPDEKGLEADLWRQVGDIYMCGFGGKIYVKIIDGNKCLSTYIHEYSVLRFVKTVLETALIALEIEKQYLRRKIEDYIDWDKGYRADEFAKDYVEVDIVINRLNACLRLITDLSENIDILEKDIKEQSKEVFENIKKQMRRK